MYAGNFLSYGAGWKWDQARGGWKQYKNRRWGFADIPKYRKNLGRMYRNTPPPGATRFGYTPRRTSAWQQFVRQNFTNAYAAVGQRLPGRVGRGQNNVLRNIMSTLGVWYGGRRTTGLGPRPFGPSNVGYEMPYATPTPTQMPFALNPTTGAIVEYVAPITPRLTPGQNANLQRLRDEAIRYARNARQPNRPTSGPGRRNYRA